MKRSASSFPAVALATAFALLAGRATTQDKQGAPATAGKGTKLAEWPALKDTDVDRVLALIGQFRKKDAELAKTAREQLVALGDAAVPMIWKQVADRGENVNDQLFLVLDAMLKPTHAALMARECQKPKVELRRYLVRRLCAFVDPECKPVLVGAAKDKDEATAFYGALGLLALQQKDQVPVVQKRCREDWNNVRAFVAEVLPAARGSEPAKWVLEGIGKAAATDQMAGLRLLRYLGTKDQTAEIRAYLDVADNMVKKEAINALRVIHGEEAIENLDVFKVIQMAAEWKKKT